MEEKSIAQMKKELQDFYFKKVKNNLDKINHTRIYENVNSILLFLLMLSIFGIMVFGFFNIEIPAICCFVFAFLFTGLIIFHNRNVKSASVCIDISGENKTKQYLMNDFLKIFGDFKWSKGGNGRDFQYFKSISQLNIINNYLIGNIDDSITGVYKDVNFRILEFDSSLSFQNLISYLVLAPFILGCGCASLLFVIAIFVMVSVISNCIQVLWTIPVLILFLLLFIVYKIITYVPFRGVFIEFDMNKNFEGHTFLFENAVSSRGLKFNHEKFEEVKLEDIEFSKKYKIYSNNQIEARVVLTTAFMERFKNMKTAFNAKYIRAAFKDKKITIAIDAGKDLFAMAERNKETTAETFVELFNEILSVLELIKVLKLNQKIGL